MMNILRTSIGIHVAVAIAVLLVFPGCHTRYFAVADAPDRGEIIKTKYKYWVVDTSLEPSWKHKSGQAFLVEANALSLKYENLMPSVFARDGIPVEVTESTKSIYDNYDHWEHNGWIFRDFGENMTPDQREVMAQVLVQTGLILVPLAIGAVYSLEVYGEEKTKTYKINFPGFDGKQKRYVNIFSRRDAMSGWCLCLPIPYFCFYGDPSPKEFDDGRIFTRHSLFSEVSKYSYVSEPSPSVADQALVYGVASLLKGLEDSGEITESMLNNASSARDSIMSRQREKAARWQEKCDAEEAAKRQAEISRRQEEERKKQEAERLRLAALEEARRRQAASQQQQYRQQQQVQAVQPQPQVVNQTINNYTTIQQVVPQEQQKPKFAITSFEPIEGDNDFSYKVVVTLNGDASPKDFFGMYGAFIDDLKNIYLGMNPGMDASSLRVDAKPSFREKKFVGVARMLTLSPERVSYNEITRRGKFSVRFGNGQYEAARAWARKNIETLVRDKNIVLETGTIPPPGRYRSLGEKKNGNILEIEFEAE